MPQSSSTPGRGPAPRGSSSRRARPTKVNKPFPWGVVAVSVVLVLALGGILAYAVANQGGGLADELANPDSIEGVVVTDDLAQVSRNHVLTPVDYPQNPPNAGDHNAIPQTCAVYTEPIAPEHALHSLEHGAVWITYNSSVSQDDVATLADEVEGDPYRMLSPVADQSSPINLNAWGRRLSVDSVQDDRIGKFLRGFTNGRQTPEPGAACVGTTATGPLAAAPAGAPASPQAPGSSPLPQASPPDANASPAPAS